jgi:hypothetical protein
LNADNFGFFIPDDLRWWQDSIQYLAEHRDQVQGFAYWAVDGLKFHHWVNETSGELHQVCMPGTKVPSRTQRGLLMERVDQQDSRVFIRSFANELSINHYACLDRIRLSGSATTFDLYQLRVALGSSFPP